AALGAKQERIGTPHEKPIPAHQPVAMPANLTGVLISLGLKDQKTTPWDGEVSISEGKIIELDIVQGNVAGKKKAGKAKGKVDGAKFTVSSVFGKKKEGIVRPILRVTLDAPASARLTVKTAQGNFEANLEDVPFTIPKTLLEGQALLQREEGAIRLTRPETEDDYPALAVAPDGKLWL